MVSSDRTVVDYIYRKYLEYYDNEAQGCCPVIADTIQKTIGGKIICGYLNFNTGRREHWWVEKDGIVHDSMGDEYVNEPGFRRIEVHRNITEMNKILPEYEQYRINIIGI